jgi:O-antigen/teichoic acid export membrane protein
LVFFCLVLGSIASARFVVLLNLAAITLAFACGAYWLKTRLPREIKDVKPKTQIGTWFRSALPLLSVRGMQLISSQSQILILGTLRDPKEAGIYVAVDRIAWLIVFVLMSLNIASAPSIAKMYAEGDLVRLQGILTRSSRVVFGVSALVWLFVVCLGSRILELFGSEFVIGYRALAILSTGFLLCTSAASVGSLLVMTKYETDAAWVTAVSAAINICLGLLLIPRYSFEGAAIAATAGTLVMNILFGLIVFLRLGIDPTILGLGRNRSKCNC